jgi:hypothetical protein
MSEDVYLLAQHTLTALSWLLYPFESEVSANNCWPVTLSFIAMC